MLIQNRRKTKDNSYALAFESSLYSGDLYWEDNLAFSVVMSVCLSVEVYEAWRGNGSGLCIYLPKQIDTAMSEELHRTRNGRTYFLFNET